MANNLESFFHEIGAMPQAERARAMEDALNQLPEDQKKALVRALSGGPKEPDQSTSNWVWRIIILTFCLLAILPVVVLVVGVWVPPVTGGTRPDTILLVFTTVTAFLAGLFAPSPVGKKG